MIQSFAVPDTLLLDLVEPLMDSIGWFRVKDPDSGYQYFHVTRPEELWSEYQRRPDGWMRHHPRAPWWVREILHELAEHHCKGQVDAYQSLFLVELLTILQGDRTRDEIDEGVRSFASSPSALVREGPALNAWPTSSPARGEYLAESMRERTDEGEELLADLSEALAAAQAIERRHLAEIVLGELTSDRGVLTRCLPAGFEGISRSVGHAKAPLLQASRLLRGRSHAEIRQLIQLFRAHGLLGIAPLELEIEWDTPAEEKSITERQQILARAALTIGLFG